jgi:hypothetical protein
MKQLPSYRELEKQNHKLVEVLKKAYSLLDECDTTMFEDEAVEVYELYHKVEQLGFIEEAAVTPRESVVVCRYCGETVEIV